MQNKNIGVIMLLGILDNIYLGGFKLATTKKTTTKKTTVKKSETAVKAAPAKKTATVSKEKYAFIFFNCDDDKNAVSMNIRYNNEAFADTAAGRKALLAKVEEESAAGRVNISDEKAVKEFILKGEPTEASAKLQYGCIERLAFVA